ncbi:DNA oxidative demethylase AlkB [Aliikangiella coralliicola]|uniref:DNA oxidative demethylase AlkB n=1 Tax=Aliikangiella coralliicola TaxID=2592383 RepID=A0A545UIQ0_9GAMM|nr:DNA oxidative demethylase AlkB [Aliikangiella coralliicola]TQV89354.1 DNA oxidative demethylase AlkB [Aliikangiella coralliicola]
MSDLFSQLRSPQEEIYPEVFVLADFADTGSLREAVSSVIRKAPFRKMMTPIGHYTGIPLTNCGKFGWVSDIHGYRYLSKDPQTNGPWPAMPEIFSTLASSAAEQVGYPGFKPDACLINCYELGTKLNAHQDKNEKDFSWPIVSVSIGLPAVFQIFGKKREGKPFNYQLHDGDVMVWGGKSRLIYHGVKTIKPDNQNPSLQQRINLTFRKAG